MDKQLEYEHDFKNLRLAFQFNILKFKFDVDKYLE